MSKKNKISKFWEECPITDLPRDIDKNGITKSFMRKDGYFLLTDGTEWFVYRGKKLIDKINSYNGKGIPSIWADHSALTK